MKSSLIGSLFVILVLSTTQIIAQPTIQNEGDSKKQAKTQDESRRAASSQASQTETAAKLTNDQGAESRILPLESNWHERASQWFEQADPKARRKQMRQMTRALKQPCRYCHTPDFKDFTEKKMISQQMMAISAEHNVACKDCHLGKKALSELGKTAQKMWLLSIRKGVSCEHCHKPKTKFKVLTSAGSDFKARQQ